MIIALYLTSGVFAFENRTYQDVLSEKYKDCKLEKENVFLTQNQFDKIKQQTTYGVPKLLLRYKNLCGQSYIYIDSHIVRTLNQTVVIEIKGNVVKSIEIASFMEPKQYLAPNSWLKQFLGKPKAEIDGLTGATLTENAIKRLVAKYRVVNKVLHDIN